MSNQDDSPALLWADGTQMWVINNDQLHRDGDKPAIIWGRGTREWYQYGKKHRTNDQPAYIGCGGTRAWYQYGKLHRGGEQPAVIGEDGKCAWWEYGICITDSILRLRRQRRALEYIASTMHLPADVSRFFVTTFI